MKIWSEVPNEKTQKEKQTKKKPKKNSCRGNCREKKIIQAEKVTLMWLKRGNIRPSF